MSLTEEILAVVGMAKPPTPQELARLEDETRNLIAESQQIGDTFDGGELKRVARDALEAAERLRSVIERTPLAANHPLRALYDDFADCAEVFALSVDPETSADLARARDEAKRSESIPWEQLRGGE
jgi:hypothetical protein